MQTTLLHVDCRVDARAGHWCEHSDFQPDQFGAAETAAVPRRGADRERLGDVAGWQSELGLRGRLQRLARAQHEAVARRAVQGCAVEPYGLGDARSQYGLLGFGWRFY